MDNLEQEISFEAAKKKVKKLKGFYIHSFIYVVVNILIIYANYTYSKNNSSVFELKHFSTALYWGIGLLAHALNVFTIDHFFGKDWEERKIRELMDREKENNDFV